MIQSESIDDDRHLLKNEGEITLCEKFDKMFLKSPSPSRHGKCSIDR